MLQTCLHCSAVHIVQAALLNVKLISLPWARRFYVSSKTHQYACKQAQPDETIACAQPFHAGESERASSSINPSPCICACTCLQALFITTSSPVSTWDRPRSGTFQCTYTCVHQLMQHFNHMFLKEQDQSLKIETHE